LSSLPWERSSFELLSPSFYFPSLPLSTLYLPAYASFEAFILLDFLLAFILLDFQLAFLQDYCYSIVGMFPTIGSDWCASSHSWPWIHRYFEVFRSNVFQLRSTNFRRPLHHTLHTIGFSALFSSTHRQPLRHPAITRRSVQPTCQIRTLCELFLPVTRRPFRSSVVVFHLRCFVISFCFVFFIPCIFLSWVLVSLGDPFTGYFVLIFVVPVLCHLQISAPPALSKGLFWTGLKASARVMPMFFTDLVSNLPCANKALALFKVNRVGTFLVLLKLKTYHSFIGYHFTYHFGTTFSDLGLLLGNPPHCFNICNPSC
jgi:hypothetical protein